MERTRKKHAGLRKIDPDTAATAQLTNQFSGSADACPSQYLAAFKRAAAYLRVPRSIVHLIDTLFAWTQKQDWMPDQQPVVWPRNATLALKLTLSVRQLQNLLARACQMRLIDHKDSPNGHRGGARTADGIIKWAYGIVLSPLAMRYEEFLAVAAEGARIQQEMTIARKRIAAARRRIASIASSPLPLSVADQANVELERARFAVQNLQTCRDPATLTNAAEQLEGRVNLLLAAMAEQAARAPETSKIAPSDAPLCRHSTTTSQHQADTSAYSNGFSEARSSAGYDVRNPHPQTPAEKDLEHYGITPAFIQATIPDIGPLPCRDLQWGDVVVLGERLAATYSINTSTWREACRTMGQKAAAAAVIATAQKFRAGIVNSPGAYLRGMSKRAAAGKLHLGRTLHGLRDSAAALRGAPMRFGDDPRSFGQITRAIVQRNSGSRRRPSPLSTHN